MTARHRRGNAEWRSEQRAAECGRGTENASRSRASSSTRRSPARRWVRHPLRVPPSPLRLCVHPMKKPPGSGGSARGPVAGERRMRDQRPSPGGEPSWLVVPGRLIPRWDPEGPAQLPCENGRRRTPDGEGRTRDAHGFLGRPRPNARCESGAAGVVLSFFHASAGILPNADSSPSALAMPRRRPPPDPLRLLSHRPSASAPSSTRSSRSSVPISQLNLDRCKSGARFRQLIHRRIRRDSPDRRGASWGAPEGRCTRSLFPSQRSGPPQLHPRLAPQFRHL